MLNSATRVRAYSLGLAGRCTGPDPGDLNAGVNHIIRALWHGIGHSDEPADHGARRSNSDRPYPIPAILCAGVLLAPATPEVFCCRAFLRTSPPGGTRRHVG